MYFCVTTPIKIGGKDFHTCICYKLTDTLKLTVEKLAKEGKATIFVEKKFFCNGKLVEKKAVVKENLTTERHKKKAKTVEVTEETEIKDESEGF